jgi:hypothetical protein
MRTFLAALLCSCATTSQPAGGPRGLHADEHLQAARQHEEAARQSWQWPERPYSDTSVTGAPWVRSWNAGDEHQRLAAAHHSEAAALYAGYDEACANRTMEEISVSPLQRYGLGGWNTSMGVILYLSPNAGPADRLLADMKCHRAWMMLSPVGMENCPLDLPGIQVDVRGDLEGITLSIVVSDPKLVPELQRRAAHELESAAARTRPSPPR